ncbi:MAG: rod shape-determining protein MreC [Lachnospiraceae bacterium]|nr:rod shape-determining protein MreC [Lachnospiraceae bacterium]MDD3659317.1 rod shape-determining protein MreC [Lachnospiraceae bacterium]
MSPIIKRKRDKFTLPSKYLLLILTFLCVILMGITFTTDYLGGSLGTISGYVVVPFQRGVSSVGGWLSNRSEELAQLRDVLQENEELKKQVDELSIQITELQQEKYELNSLRELYELDSQYADYEKTGARIIGRDSGNWFHSFLIDKGSDDGIEIDMNVIAGNGLVGIVTYTGPNWSRVTSIINDNSNVSGMILATSDNLIVSGNLELMKSGVISFGQLVDSANQVAPGDKIVTSQISDKYLPGILIGYISDIQTDSNNLTKSGKVTPAVDFEHLEEVLVIKKQKQQTGDGS